MKQMFIENIGTSTFANSTFGSSTKTAPMTIYCAPTTVVKKKREIPNRKPVISPFLIIIFKEAIMFDLYFWTNGYSKQFENMILALIIDYRKRVLESSFVYSIYLENFPFMRTWIAPIITVEGINPNITKETLH